MDEEAESCADLKSIQEYSNTLKRPFSDINSNSDPDDENDSDADVDSDDEEEEEEEEENIPKSRIKSMLMDDAITRLALEFEKDPTILQLFLNVLRPLKKKDVTPDDVDEFYGAVSEVLRYEFFIKKFYESKSLQWFFTSHVRKFGVLNQMRVDAYGKSEKLMSFIKEDIFFGEFSESKDAKLILRAVMGLLIVYCISESDFERMARLIGIPEPEVWVRGPTPKQSLDIYAGIALKLGYVCGRTPQDLIDNYSITYE